jgi:hypothetical protein
MALEKARQTRKNITALKDNKGKLKEGQTMIYKTLHR